MNTKQKESKTQTEVTTKATKPTGTSKKSKTGSSNSFEEVLGCELIRKVVITDHEKKEKRYFLSVMNNAITDGFATEEALLTWCRANFLAIIERFYIVMDYIKNQNYNK